MPDASDPIPLDVLAMWLSPEAIARIDRYFGPDRRSDQCDLELAAVGLQGVWAPGEDGPVLVEIRVKDANATPATPTPGA